MAILRTKEIRTMSENDMKAKLSEISKEIMSERAKISSGGTPTNAGKLAELKKTIARLKTIAGEKKYKLNE